MKKTIFFFLLSIIFFTFQADSNAQNLQGGDKRRCHFQAKLQNGQQIDYTSIDRLNDFTTLIDLGNNVLWLHKMKTEKNNPLWTSEFFFIATKESLKIEVNNWEEDDLSKRQYTLTASNGKKMEFKGNEIPSKGISLSPFVEKNFSPAFITGFTALKQIPTSHPEIFTLYDFIPLWGFGLMDELESNIGKGLTKNEALRSKYIPLDCSFDAKFGFPCGENEIKNGNCNILPSK